MGQSIYLFYSAGSGRLANIVSKAFERSFSSVFLLLYESLESCTHRANSIFILINPPDAIKKILPAFLVAGNKLVILGEMSSEFAEEIALEIDAAESRLLNQDRKCLGPDYDFSSFLIRYAPERVNQNLAQSKRELFRFDFTEEWNNFGFGRITLDRSIWSICQVVKSKDATVLAELLDHQGHSISVYISITNKPAASILFVNRPVGSVDSWEWTVIENFCSHFRPDDLVCIPHLKEIPAGFRGGVTMRLDCDQAIASARPLFDLYRDAGLPLSLAVVTGLPPQAEDMALLRDVIATGGSVVSHSVSHPPNWGADYAQALQEARDSKRWLEEHLPEAEPVRYAVSPFHQNPPYAVQALADAGYQGFVGGIIHNDPEYLLGRAGQVPFFEGPEGVGLNQRSLISHSQQCMLHGDCYHRYGNAIAPYCESFTNHLKAGSIFGYLDHPFSTAYQYGWSSEEERLAAHAELIRFIQSHGNIWFPNLVQCLDFIRKRDQVQVMVDGQDHLQIAFRPSDDLPPDLPSVAVGWRGETIDLNI